MQEILDARDRLRNDVEGLDGGYTTIGKLLKQSEVSVLKALSLNNKPRLSTLEKIQDAVNKAKRNQDLRLALLNG